jgi:sulfur relay (sulfurtransferase) DsrF/TusC family protein
MPTRVLSVLRGADAGAARSADPALDLNAYAVAEDVELTLVLKDAAVELGLEQASSDPGMVAGIAVPAARPATDLLALLGSGVVVLAVTEDLATRGLDPAQLLPGIDVVDEPALAGLIAEHHVTLTTTS